MKAITSMKDIAELIKHARVEQGLSQETLAGISGCGRRFIVDIENGKPTIQTEKLITVLSALGFSIAVLEKWKLKNENNT